ncbi:MAG: hypothetical protein HYZ58_11750, partial [Acidobacteria bacterium]|nr:hypothetical protein [Acidobacteriota bacterium]
MNSIVQLLAYEGLTATDRNGRLVGKLAERWQVSRDGLSWTFHLRRPLRFHDGTSVTAREVKQALDRTLADPEARQSYPTVSDIQAIEVVSDSDIIIRLKKPSGLLLDSLAVPVYKVDSKGGRVGTGPFKPTRTGANQIEMEAHRQY